MPSTIPMAAELTDLLEIHWRGCFNVALTILHDPAKAEDAAQEAFVALVAAKRIGRSPDKVGPWLRGTTVNKARMSARGEARRKKRELDAGAQRWQASARHQESLSELDALTAGLPDALRVPVELHYGLGYTHAEIAERLDCPRGTVASRLRRGIEQIGELLEARGEALTVTAISGLIAAAYETLGSEGPPAPSIAELVRRATTLEPEPEDAFPDEASGLGPAARAAVAATALAAAAALLGLAVQILGPDDASTPTRNDTSSLNSGPESSGSPTGATPDENLTGGELPPASGADAGDETGSDAEPPSDPGSLGRIHARPLPLGQMLHPGVAQFTVSPDKRLGASASQWPARIVVWNLAERSQVLELSEGLGNGVRGLAFIDDGTLAASLDDGLVVWNAEGGGEQNRLPGAWDIRPAPTPDGRSVLLPSEDPEPGKGPQLLDVFSGARRPAPNPAPRLRPFVSDDDPLVVEVWNGNGWRELASVETLGLDPEEGLGLFLLDRAGRRLYCATSDSLVMIDMQSLKVVARVEAEGEGMSQLFLSQDESTLAAYGDRGLTLYEPGDLTVRQQLWGGPVAGAAFVEGGQAIVAATRPHLRHWRLGQGDLSPRGRERLAAVQHVFTRGSEMVSVDRAGQACFWSGNGQLRASGRLPLPFEELEIPEDDPEAAMELMEGLESEIQAWDCRAAVIAEDAVWIAAINYMEHEDDTAGVGLHRVGLDGRVLGRAPWPFQDGQVFQVAFSADGKRVAASTEKGTRILTLPGLQPVSNAELPPGESALSGDGTRLALKTGGAEVKVFDVAKGTLLATLDGQPAQDVELAWGFSEEDLAPIELVGMSEANAPASPRSVVGVTLSADGSLALLSRTEGRASVWDVDEVKELWSSDAGYGISLCADGTAVLCEATKESGESEVLVVRRVDARTGRPVGPELITESPGAGMWSAALSADARRLVGGTANAHGGGGFVVIWDLPAR